MRHLNKEEQSKIELLKRVDTNGLLKYLVSKLLEDSLVSNELADIRLSQFNEAFRELYPERYSELMARNWGTKGDEIIGKLKGVIKEWKEQFKIIKQD